METGVGRNVKKGLYRCFCFAGSDEVGTGTCAEDKIKRTEDNRLTRPGLSGKYAEAGSERDMQVIDDGEVFYI